MASTHPSRSTASGPWWALVSLAVVGTVASMLLPLSPAVLDALIVLNLGSALTLFLASLLAAGTARLSALPTLLLLATLFRLALNVSSTRLILLEGEAGLMIDTFAEFVVGGSYVVGAVIFLLLACIQLIVVAKGADRAAEVNARFRMEWMPQEQMRIENDRRIGILSAEGAKEQRRQLDLLTGLASSMTAALKFVKGDSIVGLVIIAINILGGLAVGVLQMGMSVSSAAGHYTLLTIGDGMVTQIPSLLNTLAAAVVITRVDRTGDAEGTNLAKDLFSQILEQPKSLGVAGCVLLMIGVTGAWTGFPTLPCVVIGGVLVAVAICCARRPIAEHTVAPVSTGERPARRSAGAIAHPDIEIEIAPDLVPVFRGENGILADVRSRIDALLVRLSIEGGVRLPPWQVSVRTHVPAGAYAVVVRSGRVAEGCVDPARHAAICQATVLAEHGVESSRGCLPGLPIEVHMVAEADVAALREADIPVKAPLDMILDHLEQVLRRSGSAFLGVQEAHDLLDGLRETHGELVSAIERSPGLPRLTEILKQLLDEQVVIRDLRAVLDSVVRWSQEDGLTFDQVIDGIRLDLRRVICASFSSHGRQLDHYRLAPDVEQRLLISRGIIDEHDFERIRDAVAATLDFARHVELPPVFVVSDRARKSTKDVLTTLVPEVVVLSASECAGHRCNELGFVEVSLGSRVVSPLDGA